MRSAGAAHKNMEAPQSIDSGDARKWHLVTSHSYDTRERIVSHAWYEILRLSPHLFWLVFPHIGRFPPLRMTIREGGWSHRLAVSPPF